MSTRGPIILFILLVIVAWPPAFSQNIAGDVGSAVNESGAQSLAGALASASVEPSSGVLQASLPISIPAARGGAQPGITLSYSSASGYREAGVGWGLDLPVIERKNLSGPPRNLFEMRGLTMMMGTRYSIITKRWATTSCIRDHRWFQSALLSPPTVPARLSRCQIGYCLGQSISDLKMTR
jgi:Salmonella virulence plasmid 65kDa B protein